MNDATAELIIGSCYALNVGAFSVTLVRLLLVKESGFVRGGGFWATCLFLALLDFVFIFCGSQYLTQSHNLFLHHIVETFLLAPFAIGLAIACNPITAILGFDEIKAVTQKPKELAEAKQKLDVISQSSVSCIAIVEVRIPYQDVRVIWHTAAFESWYKEITEEKAASRITGVNWYDIFPAPERWKTDHAKVHLAKVPIENPLDYWAEKDTYLQWAIAPSGDYQIWSFVDVSALGRETAKVAAQRDRLIELGWEGALNGDL